MEYRPFGKLDSRVSALGFGCMRLPTLGDPARINEPEAIRMLRFAIDNGVNYVDTAYPYHGGNSERVVGKALRDGYRPRVKLATKLYTAQAKTYADFDRMLNEQLVKLQTDHIDFYLLHGLRRSYWDRVRDLDVTGWAEGAIRDGRIGQLGFSFHDDAEALRYIVDGYDRWAMCQVQYNFMDVHNQAGTEGVRYAASKGLAVSIMEPLLGGRLADAPPAVQAIWQLAPVQRSPVEWALDWVWHQPEVSVVLSGMSAMAHVVENLAYAGRSGVNLLTDEELDLVAQAREAYLSLYPIPCTECRYCMPCPNGLDIPMNFVNFNRGVGLGQLANARFRYGYWDKAELAGECLACGECAEKCPQGIAVSQWMPVIDQVLGKGVAYSPALAPV